MGNLIVLALVVTLFAPVAEHIRRERIRSETVRRDYLRYLQDVSRTSVVCLRCGLPSRENKNAAAGHHTHCGNSGWIPSRRSFRSHYPSEE